MTPKRVSDPKHKRKCPYVCTYDESPPFATPINIPRFVYDHAPLILINNPQRPSRTQNNTDETRFMTRQ